MDKMARNGIYGVSDIVTNFQNVEMACFFKARYVEDGFVSDVWWHAICHESTIERAEWIANHWRYSVRGWFTRCKKTHFHNWAIFRECQKNMNPFSSFTMDPKADQTDSACLVAFFDSTDLTSKFLPDLLWLPSTTNEHVRNHSGNLSRWYSETGEWYWETGSGIRKLESCIRKLASCIRKLAFGNWNPGIRQLGPRRRKHAIYWPEKVANLISYEDRLKRISLSIYCLEVVAILIPSYNKLKLRCPSNPINVYLGGGGSFDPSWR